jgi:hypothetical protein
MRVLCLADAGRVRWKRVYTPRQRTVDPMEKIKIEQHSFTGGLWFAAWLFTIGFLHLTFWRGVLAIVIWPYYIGVKISALLH